MHFDPIVSIGTRLTNNFKNSVQSVTTLVVNPIMGHLSTSYATSLSPVVSVSTRYDFNIYSYNSDISVGIEFSPISKDHLLQGRFSLANVFLILLITIGTRFLSLWKTGKIYIPNWNGNIFWSEAHTNLWPFR